MSRGNKPKLIPIAGGKGKLPPAPRWMAAEAQAEWKRTGAQLAARIVLTPDVLALLETYCIAAGQVIEAEKVMAEEGRTVAGQKGNVALHPMARLQNQAMSTVCRVAALLELTPKAQARTVRKDPADDGWSSLLA